MIVEDSAIVRERLAALVSRCPGVRLAGVAEDGLKALLMFSEHRPDLVLLDIELPGLNGLKVLEVLKRDHPSCRVVVLTTYAFAELRDHCTKLGADYFLSKSAEFDKLTAILTQA